MEVCDREIETVLNQLTQRFESACHAEAGAPQPEQAVQDPQREHAVEAQTQRRVKEKRKRKPRAKEPKIDLWAYLERICGVDLTQVVGLNVMSVLLIVSEIGVDIANGAAPKHSAPGWVFVRA